MAAILQNVVDKADLLGNEFSTVEDISKKLLSNLKSIGSESYEQLDIQEEINKANDKSSRLLEDKQDLAKKLTSLIRERGRAERAVDSGAAKRLEERLTAQINAIKTNNTHQTATLKQLDEIKELEQKIDELKKVQSDRASGIYQTQQDYLENKIKEVKEAESNLDAQREVLDSLRAQQEVLDRANETAKELGINVKNMADELSAPFERTLDFINNIPGGTFLRKAFGVDKVMEDVSSSITSQFTKSLAETGSVGASSFAALSTGAGTFMATLGPILLILLAIAAAAYLVKMALDIDKEISETAKSMGQTKHEALEAHEQFASIAIDTQIIGANIEALTEANKELNAVLGTNVTASKRMLEAQVLLTKQYGLTGEEAADFQVTSASTGKTVDQNLATIQAMVEGYNTMTGDSQNFKEITKDIAKTSKATLASYHGDVKALTLAAIQAKKMGMSLEDTQAVADKLLRVVE
jgi:hypothetical protein